MKIFSKMAFTLFVILPLYAFAFVPKTTEIVPPPPIRYSKAYNEKIIREVFKENAADALKIAKCESSLDNLARGDSGFSIGIFQIYTKVHTQHSIEQLQDPLYNAILAKELFDKEDWRPWTCRNVLL